MATAAPQLTGQDTPVALLAVEADLEAMLRHRDPTLRGEAALALSITGNPGYYDEIRSVAADSSPQTRLRGILALGRLAAPGSASYLGELLLQSDQAAERAAAAMALGLLPDTQPAPAIHRYLQTVRGGSYRRHRETLAGLLVGLLREPHPSRSASVRAMLEDGGNREPGLRRLALRVLVPQGEEAPAELLLGLDSDQDLARLGALEALGAVSGDLSAEVTAQIEAMARRDKSPRVRTAALRHLMVTRQLSSLEIGMAALRSSDPEEAAAGVHAARRLGGGKIRATMEESILSARRPELQAAMLSAYDIPASAGFVEECLALASDRRGNEAVRVHAAALAARSGDRRARPALRTLFVEAEDADNLRVLAIAMHELDPSLIALDHIHPPVTAHDEQLLPARMGALIAIDHPGAGALLRRALRSPSLDDRTGAELIRALRRNIEPQPVPSDLELLPRELREILE